MAETKLIQKKIIELLKNELLKNKLKKKEITQFLYVMTDETILNQLYFDQLNFGNINRDNLTVIIRNYRKYREQMNGLVQFTIPDYIKIPFYNKIQSIYSEYDNIINKLDKLKILKTKFIISKYNECLKHLEYAEEECSDLEKLLSSLSKINKYCEEIDNLITNIIMLPIQCRTFCISTYIDIDIISKYTTYEINEQYLKVHSYQMDNTLLASSFAQLYCVFDYALIPEEYETFYPNSIVRF
jgi:hypothetical protein